MRQRRVVLLGHVLQVLRVTPSTAWLDAFDAASLRHMEGFTPQGLADILAAQVRRAVREVERRWGPQAETEPQLHASRASL